MSDAWSLIKIREFEHVVTGPSKSLLRVSGQAPRRRQAGERPMLVIDDATTQHRFSPLSAPADRSRVLRAAFAVPTQLIGVARSFVLEHADGGRTALPTPEPGVRLRPEWAEHVEPPAEAPVVPSAPAPPAIGRSEQPPATTGDDGADRAHAESEQLRAQLAAVQEAHTIELRAATRRTAQAETRATEAQGAAAAARAREQSAIDQLAASAANIESLSRRGSELEQAAGALRAQLAEAEQNRDQARGALLALEREMNDLRNQRTSLERELDHARDQLRIMTFERDELSRQATAFDGIAVKARERAAQAEEAYKRSSATLQELEVWRSELERRLAATTSELGALRAARDADERELARMRAALAESERQVGASGVDGNDLDGMVDGALTVAEQAAEIERLAAELASLRARTARGAAEN